MRRRSGTARASTAGHERHDSTLLRARLPLTHRGRRLTHEAGVRGGTASPAAPQVSPRSGEPDRVGQDVEGCHTDEHPIGYYPNSDALPSGRPPRSSTTSRGRTLRVRTSVGPTSQIGR